MIGKLKGMVDSYGDDFVIIDVGGVGYEVFCSTRTLQALPPVGEAATLSIETYVREDAIRLYGFATDLEREWFRLLQTVQGVGAKVALSVLGLFQAGRPRDGDRATGQGGARARARASARRSPSASRPNFATRRRRWSSADPNVVRLQDQIAERRAPQPVADAVSALVNLGYQPVQASAAIASASRSAGESADDRVADPTWTEGAGAVSE